ncbi:MAG: peroxidase-related enzyme [Acidisphaera sp.]|nr:peroxidase-related enzyme [Acidisphaera sp.]
MKFTLQAVEWNPWLPVVDPASATPEQAAALDKSPSATSPYFLTLAHDVASLDQRSPLFHSVMYAPRGLPRAERELATVVTSVVNGCVYCSSVHARRFAELTKQPEVIARLYEEGLGTPLDARRRAIVDFAAALTQVPPAATQEHLAALRSAGLGDLEILDLIHAVAMFANANRLMQTLGEPVPPVT